MNLTSRFLALKKYGLKGVVDFLARQPREWAFRRFLQRTIRPQPPGRGITLIASFRDAQSLSKVMRDMAILLKKSGIPYQTLDIPCKNPIPRKEVEPFITPRDNFCFNRYSHIVAMRTPIDTPADVCKSFCVEFWEFDDGFVKSRPEALRANNILALSDFNRSVFRRELPNSINVDKILYPFQFVHGELTPEDDTRRKYGIGTDDFVVFFNFDFASSYFRKNPEGLLSAFTKALGDKPDAKVVFKTMRAKKCKAMSDRLHAFANRLGIADKLITIDDFIPQEDLVNLTNACDVYMSLHRGEGFGLGIAEAMSLGKPVIVTDYSSTREFCNNENSMPIPFKMVPVQAEQLDTIDYKYVTSWPEPDVDAAADALIRLYGDAEFREQLGHKAQLSIAEQFSVTKFRESINSFLDRHNETPTNALCETESIRQ